MAIGVHLLTASRLDIASAGDVSRPSASFLLRKVRGGVNVWARRRSRGSRGQQDFLPPSRWFNIQKLATAFLPPRDDGRAKAALTALGARTYISGAFMWTCFPTGTMAAVCARVGLRVHADFARVPDPGSDRMDRKNDVDQFYTTALIKSLSWGITSWMND